MPHWSSCRTCVIEMTYSILWNITVVEPSRTRDYGLTWTRDAQMASYLPVGYILFKHYVQTLLEWNVFTKMEQKPKAVKKEKAKFNPYGDPTCMWPTFKVSENCIFFKAIHMMKHGGFHRKQCFFLTMQLFQQIITHQPNAGRLSLKHQTYFPVTTASMLWILLQKTYKDIIPNSSQLESTTPSWLPWERCKLLPTCKCKFCRHDLTGSVCCYCSCLQSRVCCWKLYPSTPPEGAALQRGGDTQHITCLWIHAYS